jgi:uncharacterized protein (TIRG00374 family)
MPQAPATDGAMPILRGWRYQTVIWFVLLSAVGYLAFALWGGGGWRSVAIAAEEFGPSGMALLLALSLLNYALRFVRWQAYLSELGYQIPWWSSCRIYLAGFALTTTPARLGQAFRSVLLKPLGVPYAASLTAMFSERISDVVAILLLAMMGLSAYPRAQSLIGIAAIGLLCVMLFSLSHKLLERVRTRIHGNGKASQLLRKLMEVLAQVRRCHGPRLLVWSTCLSMAAWIAEAWSFYLVVKWMGVEITPMLAMALYAISMLAGALSFLPGGIGGAEGTMILLLNMVGMGTTEAIAATVLIRLTTLWFAVSLGAFFLIRLPKPAD